MILGNDHNFYGATGRGGVNDAGTFFRITPAGVLTVEHNFSPATDGQYAKISVQDANGKFYGTAYSGGFTGAGTLFRIDTTGRSSVLHSFGLPDAKYGTNPNGVILATDGNLYGTTESGGTGYGIFPVCDASLGGTTGCGTLFEYSQAGVFTILHSFCAHDNCGEGSTPIAPPMQSTNGVIYGTTAFGGASKICGNLESGCGTIYGASLSIPPFVRANPIFGKVGFKIRIIGSDLSAATSVMFNGLPASYVLESDTSISATVPTGATTGAITVIKPSGTLTSDVPFQVLR